MPADCGAYGVRQHAPGRGAGCAPGCGSMRTSFLPPAADGDYTSKIKVRADPHPLRFLV
jgi:hypothetical protein